MSDLNNALNNLVGNPTDELEEEKKEVDAANSEKLASENQEKTGEKKNEDKTQKPKPVDPLDKALARIQALEDSNRELLEQSEKWKSFSRKHEQTVKEMKREKETAEILKEYSLPDEAKDFLKGESLEEMKESAKKLSVIFGSNSKQEEKKPFISKIQGVSGEAVKTSPLASIFKGWGED